jgi:hypothetical protein
MSASKAKNSLSTEMQDRAIVISRVFAAPRELIWNACTDPKQLVQWWGPRDFTITIHEMDVRPGGIWKHTLQGPDGTDYPTRCVFCRDPGPRTAWLRNRGQRQKRFRMYRGPSVDVRPRRPGFFEPHATGTDLLQCGGRRTRLLLTFKQTEWALAGQTKTQMFDSIKAAYDKKDLPLPEPGAML